MPLRVIHFKPEVYSQNKMEIYCVKEKKNTKTPNVSGSQRYERARNGRLMLKVKRANCGIKNRFESKKALN